MTTFQLNGTFASQSVTTTPAILDIPNGSTGVVICNPDTTNSVFVHLIPLAATAPTSAENLRGIRIYPGTSLSISVMGDPPYGCAMYVCTNSGSITVNAYGVC
jgi:hypothetical protein